MKMQKGFSLLELMMAVAIVAILASIAIPLYSDYMARSKIAEALYLLGGLKKPFIESYMNNGTWPAVSTLGGKTSGNYVSSVTSGIIIADQELYFEATMGAGAGPTAGRQLRMIWYPKATGFDWKCTTEGTANPIQDKYLPAPCR